MATWYVNPSAANDAGAGTSWGTAKKNISAVTPTAGDEIRVAKSTTTALTGTLTWTDGSTTVTTSADLTGVLSARQMISKTADGSDGWWEVASVTPATITLAFAYAGSSSASASVRLDPFDVGSPASPTTTVQQISAAGSNGSPILLTGGWNTSTSLQDGQTHFWVSGASRNGTFSFANSYATVSKIHLHRFGYGFYISNSSTLNITINDCGSHSSGVYAAYLTGTRVTLTNFLAAGGSSGPYLVGYANANANVSVRGVTNYGIVLAGRQGRVDNLNVYRANVGIQASGGDINTVVGGAVSRVSTGVAGNGGRTRVAEVAFDYATTVYSAAYGPLFISDCAVSNFTTLASASSGGSINLDRHNTTAGDHRRIDGYGTVLRNPTGGKVGTPAVELQPSASTDFALPLEQSWPIPCQGGVARNIQVWLRRSAGWNGSAIKVGIRRMGDWVAPPTTVSSVGSAEWKQALASVTCPSDEAVELVVLADGTAGSVFADDISWS